MAMGRVGGVEKEDQVVRAEEHLLAGEQFREVVNF